MALQTAFILVSFDSTREEMSRESLSNYFQIMLKIKIQCNVSLEETANTFFLLELPS